MRRTSQNAGTKTSTLKFSVNLSSDVGAGLRHVAHEHRVSESSVIEIALEQLFASVPAAELGDFLLRNGACLRRRR